MCFTSFGVVDPLCPIYVEILKPVANALGYPAELYGETMTYKPGT